MTFKKKPNQKRSASMAGKQNAKMRLFAGETAKPAVDSTAPTVCDVCDADDAPARLRTLKAQQEQEWQRLLSFVPCMADEELLAECWPCETPAGRRYRLDS